MENISAGQPEEHESLNPHLSHKETRQIVTPYAFHVAPDLFGTPLAKPKKRGLAIGIDLLLIAILSQSASFILAGVAAVTFFKAGNRLKLRKRFNTARLGLRFMAATLLFVFAWGLFAEFEGDNKTDMTDGVIGQGINGIAIGAITGQYMLGGAKLFEKVENQACQPAFDCWQTLGDKFVSALQEVPLQEKEFSKLVSTFLDLSEEQLSPQQKTQLNEAWHLKRSTQDDSTSETNLTDDLSTDPQTKQVPDAIDKSESKVGLIAWIEGIMEDLGLGLGWAAFYFSIFTAWWQGQTPGKKLLGIKVIKLDGNGPNLWESFGRYGGYGAGFATGLLGFLQVYWDPNRQAIQDKISETLVIDIRKPKVMFNTKETKRSTTDVEHV